MPYHQPEWLSLNNGRSFPIREDASRISPTGFVIPYNLLVDLNVCVANEPAGVYISAVCLTPKIVTIVLASVATGTTLATCSAFPGKDRPWISKPVDPIADGVAGFAAFGSFLDDGHSDAFRSFKGTNQFDTSCIVEARCVIDIASFPVTSIRASSATENLSGSATLTVGGDMSVAVSNGEDDDQEVLTYLTLSLNNPEDFIPACATAPDQSLCASNPILSINDTVPDENGNITIEFIGFTTEQMAEVLKAYLLLTGTAFCPAIPIPDDIGQLPPYFTDR